MSHTQTIRPQSIPSYELPDASVLQLNNVNWQLERESAVLLIHDMQNYWIEPFEDPDPFINNIRKLRRECHIHDIPIICTALKVAEDDAERGLAYDLFGPGIGRALDARPDDHEIIAALAPSGHDYLLEKTKYSAFFRTELEYVLRKWKRSQIVLCGIFAHHGCMITAVDAYMRDFQIFFVADALGDHSREAHHMAVHYVAKVCGQIVLTNDVSLVFNTL